MFHSDDINLGVNGGDEKGKVIRTHIMKGFGHDAKEFTLQFCRSLFPTPGVEGDHHNDLRNY